MICSGSGWTRRARCWWRCGCWPRWAWFAEHIASFGADVVVSEPADLRDAVITRLKGALA